jgi:hypothetical protein
MMPLWAAGLLAAIGVAALMAVWAARRKQQRRWMIAAAIAGALVVLAALAYILLALVFLKAASEQPPWRNGVDFGPNLAYAEEYVIQGDPGENMSAAEAAKRTFDAVRDNGNIPEYSDALEYTMTLVDLANVENEECYVYRLDVDEPGGTLGAAYAYAYESGNIYMQGSGGQWVKPEGLAPAMPAS